MKSHGHDRTHFKMAKGNILNKCENEYLKFKVNFLFGFNK